MSKAYGDLMSLLLHHRERYATEEEFRRFVLEAVRHLARDLRDFQVDVTVRPAAYRARPAARDWNFVRFGCE